MTTPTRSPGGKVDGLDDLLTAYFQSEMPRPWPTLRLPFANRPTRRSWLAPVRSRLALAASMALLVCGALILGGSTHTVKEPAAIPGLGDGSAKHESMGRVKSEVFLQQSPDGPTTICITIDDLPVAR